MPTLAPPQVFQLPLAQVYGTHWSNTGHDVPDAHSPDAAVDLPGRNLLVVLQAAIWCHLNGIPTLALGLLKSNPFPDSTPQFFAAYEQALNLGLDANLELVRPYSSLTKAEVLRRGQQFPLELTWSCMQPHGDVHCGQCNKCFERRKAFAAAGLSDHTTYQHYIAIDDAIRR
jgi:7-cyano-7-deazaguanine synthase